MTSIEELAVELQALMGAQADEIGRTSGFIQRERVLTGSSFVQGLVFSYLANPGASLAEVSQGVAQAQPPLSRQGVARRLTERGAEFLRQMVGAAVEVVVEGEAQDSELLHRFSGVYLRDSTCVELPLALAEQWLGCGGYAAGKRSASLKIMVEWEMQRGQLAEVILVDGRTHDQKGTQGMEPLPPNSLLVQDLGFFNLGLFAELDRQGSYWLSRYKRGVQLWYDATQPLTLLPYLQSQCATPGQTLELI